MPSTLFTTVRCGLGGPLADVLVTDGRVAAVGAAGTVSAPDAQRVTARDATLLPGFVDGHVHVEQWARHLHSVDLGAATGPLEAAAALRSALGTAPGRERVHWGHGIVPALWSTAPHKRHLDDAVGDLPVAVSSIDLHTTWLNSAALALVGLGEHPTGVLRETESIQTKARLAAMTPEAELDGWIREAVGGLPALGVTGLTDLAYADTIADWQRRSAAGAPPVRVRAGIWEPWLEAAVAGGHRSGAVVAGTDGRVRVGPFKIVSDGSLNTRTAWCVDPYPHPSDDAGRYGLCLVDPDDLVDLMSRAWAAGLEPAVHAIGDRANRAVLDAFEQVGCPGRVEHAQLVRREDMARFARLDVVASVQPQHAVTDRDVADLHWAGRTDRAFAFRSLLDAGARLELGSDAPVSPLDPRMAIADAVYRTDDERPAWHPEQTVPLEVAVAAASAGVDGVETGMVADLVLVEGDPHELDREGLRTLGVLATMVEGTFTYREV
ncbi:amidohydrolase [Phycicoccus endophyticus]|uniref:Amidohydrolase n=1 Tax=Phycicoccus endophyticus TaxID=1690220 RepID=A0A7G9QZP2_9MICO|nr:amidohydrolase [Phycicoccus endophyticus]NHI20009.1 amidohydrolase [Phycicoccus endophyticus]QNN48817.1 amidohydrolase [Phycicoccus endophyticus]GGL42632.1 amidohydrolase [Phycicoccus endophyticus]